MAVYTAAYLTEGTMPASETARFYEQFDVAMGADSYLTDVEMKVASEALGHTTEPYSPPPNRTVQLVAHCAERRAGSSTPDTAPPATTIRFHPDSLTGVALSSDTAFDGIVESHAFLASAERDLQPGMGRKTAMTALARATRVASQVLEEAKESLWRHNPDSPPKPTPATGFQIQDNRLVYVNEKNAGAFTALFVRAPDGTCTRLADPAGVERLGPGRHVVVLTSDPRGGQPPSRISIASAINEIDIPASGLTLTHPYASQLIAHGILGTPAGSKPDRSVLVAIVDVQARRQERRIPSPRRIMTVLGSIAAAASCMVMLALPPKKEVGSFEPPPAPTLQVPAPSPTPDHSIDNPGAQPDEPSIPYAAERVAMSSDPLLDGQASSVTAWSLEAIAQYCRAEGLPQRAIDELQQDPAMVKIVSDAFLEQNPAVAADAHNWLNAGDTYTLYYQNIAAHAVVLRWMEVNGFATQPPASSPQRPDQTSSTPVLSYERHDQDKKQFRLLAILAAITLTGVLSAQARVVRRLRLSRV